MITVWKLRDDKINECSNCGKFATMQIIVDKPFDSHLVLDFCNRCWSTLGRKMKEPKK